MVVVGLIGVGGTPTSEAAFVDSGVSTGSFSAASMFDGSTCNGSGLAFDSLDVEDVSTGSGGGGQSATFEVTYSVSDPAGGDQFDHVETILYMNGDEKDSTSSESQYDTLTVEMTGNAQQDYTIVVQLYNTSGGVVQEFETTDAKGGEEPPAAC